MSANLAAQPTQTPLLEMDDRGKLTPYASKAWMHWWWTLGNRAEVSAYQVYSQSWTGQTASLGLTTLVPLPSAGLYRVNWYVRVTAPGSVSSSLQVTVSFSDDGVACSVSGAALAGNTVTTLEGQSVIVRCDGAAPIQISTAYASDLAGEMTYDLAATVESL